MEEIIRNLAVQIVRFVDECQPGWVECEFADAEGRQHRVTDKAPMFTVEDINKGSRYPRAGVLRCVLESHWRDESGRDLARINTARPDDIESSEGLSEFVVLSGQLSG